VSAQSNKSTATLLIFFKLSSDLFGKSRISPEFFRNFWGLVSLVRPRTGRNLAVETSATTYLTDPRTLPLSQRLRSPNAVWNTALQYSRRSVCNATSIERCRTQSPILRFLLSFRIIWQHGQYSSRILRSFVRFSFSIVKTVALLLYHAVALPTILAIDSLARSLKSLVDIRRLG